MSESETTYHTTTDPLSTLDSFIRRAARASRDRQAASGIRDESERARRTPQATGEQPARPSRTGCVWVIRDGVTNSWEWDAWFMGLQGAIERRDASSSLGWRCSIPSAPAEVPVAPQNPSELGARGPLVAAAPVVRAHDPRREDMPSRLRLSRSHDPGSAAALIPSSRTAGRARTPRRRRASGFKIES
jgi:hypothetical protein